MTYPLQGMGDSNTISEIVLGERGDTRCRIEGIGIGVFLMGTQMEDLRPIQRRRMTGIQLP